MSYYTLTPVATTLPRVTAHLAKTMTRVRYLILDRATLEPLSTNSFGKSTGWAFWQKDAAERNAARASLQIRPALLLDCRTGGTYDVTR